MPGDKGSLGMRTEGRAGISAREDGSGEEKVSPGSGTLCDHAWCGGSEPEPQPGRSGTLAQTVRME